jgi:L-amino acid N-acyltransferase YncA
VHVRPCTDSDLEPLNDIYNQYVRETHFTEQGRQFGRYWDVAWYEKPLGNLPPDAAG